MKAQFLLAILLLMTQISCGQTKENDSTSKNSVSENTKAVNDTIDGVYIPKDLEDCFREIDKFWDDSTKAQVIAWSEDEFTANAHFGFGLWMRNNWKLWGGSRLAEYFIDLEIHHPDDMSGIILVSYHRYLNKVPINLEKQIEYYKAYWSSMKIPEKEDYPKGVGNIELNQTMMFELKDGKMPGAIHIQTNAKGDLRWIYSNGLGWLQLTNKELESLDNPETREEVLKELFDKE
mgnify:CR=1 FL=1